ncbi:hypothetical protein Y032_0758g2104 [Ancylostoma ceylanicum]|uniref:Uncharacterized protein n=1 Tax=Ancylostoma ceylanicum TaxID=53326 RepID=A0A016WFU7_9BILA|nr:hypothetical protein Y032_0758g2104 [Ancylostoma ceylanicum]
MCRYPCLLLLSFTYTTHFWNHRGAPLRFRVPSSENRFPGEFLLHSARTPLTFIRTALHDVEIATTSTGLVCATFSCKFSRFGCSQEGSMFSAQFNSAVIMLEEPCVSGCCGSNNPGPKSD